MKAVALIQPGNLVFGTGSMARFESDFVQSGHRKALIILSRSVKKAVEGNIEALRKNKVEVEVVEYLYREPTVSNFHEILDAVHRFEPDSVIGIGGGSILDVAKLVAAMHHNPQTLDDVWGINRLTGRKTHLVCIPTTSGTGSEVSPNAVLLDEKTLEKKAVISPYLVPDASYIEPSLTITLPPKITAETGIDALSHCIEAYTNKFSHPIIDFYALKGIELISQNIYKAYTDGADIEARTAVALGSMYGGMCLGPVNTAAIHALSYPLGGKYHIPHGLANAVLLPEVMAFNMEANVYKHAQIALAAGVEEAANEKDTAQAGVEKMRQLTHACGIPKSLLELGIAREAVDELVDLGMKVTRLLKNNPRELNAEDAKNIYNKLF